MKAPSRVDRIAAAVAKHCRETVEPMGFKAFLVAVDREACCLYKEALNKFLPEEMTRVVISAAHNDSELLRKYHLDELAEKELRRQFVRKDTQPKILIVTEKLLTGFDAPILYCMYLDKPMRDHVLLQAIARVNRPYEDDEGQKKPCGFVMDFVGVFERLEKALAFDSDVVASVIQNLDVLRDLFAKMMAEEGAAYLPLARGWDDKSKERALVALELKEDKEKFYRFFKQIQMLYDILSPDAFLRPYIEDFQALTMLYALVRNSEPHPYVDRELTAKTKSILRERTALYSVDLPNKIQELGAEELSALKESDANDTTKVLNLRKALAEVMQREGAARPFVVSIGERAEALAVAYEDRQLTTQQVLLAFEKLADEYVEAEDERKQLNVDENTYAIYTTLKAKMDGVSSAEAQKLNALYHQYPDYQWDPEQGRKLRTELYKALRPLVGPAKMVDTANALLRLQRV